MGRLARLNFSQAADKGSFCQLTDPDTNRPMFVETLEGDKWVPDLTKPVGVYLLGIDSDAYRKQEAENRDAALDDMRKGEPPSAAKSDDRATKLLVACTVGWENFPVAWIDGSDNEEPVTFSPRAAAAVYSGRGTNWIRNFVDQKIADRSRFLIG